ncbi:hypothetical protein ACF0H5_014314 [Mactra antiquata]
MAMKIPDEDLELSDCEEPVSISKEQLQLLESLKKLGIENTDDVTRLIKNKAKAFGINKESVGDTTPHVNSDTKFSSTYHYPKLATFYGEDNKGEVSWPTFKFEVESLQSAKVFNEEQILLGIRRSLKGNASDVIRRLGTGVTVNQVLRKLECTFGNIETKESILCKFFSCKQKVNESISNYLSRLEGLQLNLVYPNSSGPKN